ncbi:MAG: rhomboid family intramembrane serine protease [Kofleriaceae bacterium]
MSRRGSFGSRFAGLKITPGAMVVAGLEIGLSLVWLLSSPEARASMSQYLEATPSNVFVHGRVWTLVTSPFLEHGFVNLLLHAVVLWMFVPTLERFWGTPRFYRFFAVTSVLGTVAGTLLGFLINENLPILGLSPFIYASIVAFGIVYARQPVQFFGVLPLTGRQLMYGFIAFLILFVALQQLWQLGAAFAAAMIGAGLMTSKRFSPGLVWRRWRIARARSKLSVIDGGKPARPRDEQKWLN